MKKFLKVEYKTYGKVKAGNGQENAQSEINSHSKNRGGKN